MAGYKRKRGDAWQLIATVGTDFTGKPRRFTKTVRGTEREAEKALQRFVIECEDGTVNHSGSTTVTALSSLYMDDVRRFQKRSSQFSEESHLKTWILPLLGKRKINTLKRLDIQLFVNTMADKGKSRKTILNNLSTLKSMLDYAVDVGLIDANPCANVRLPKTEPKTERKAYTLDELQCVCEALNGAHSDFLVHVNIIYLGLFGGFRKGEILGFNWSDLNLETGEISVIRTRNYDRNASVYEDTPKTTKSERRVVLPSVCIDKLRALKAQQAADKLLLGADYQDTPAIIRDRFGAPLSPNVTYKWFMRFCESKGLPFYGLHALRHTHASLLASLGADKVQVSNRLGHAHISTTLNIYTHLFEDRDRQIADDLNNFIERKKAIR